MRRRFFVSERGVAFLLSILFVFSTSEAFARRKKTLIKMKGGKPQAELATAWTKLAEGKYEFKLDTSASISKKKKLTAEFVKNSLEAKLGSVLSVKVDIKGPDTVHVNYKGDEKKFLKMIGRTRIRAKKSVALALESSVSEGGIRAKIPTRGPEPAEVKVKLLSMNGSSLEVLVIEKGKNVDGKVRPGKKLSVTVDSAGKLSKGQVFFFKPSPSGDAWKGVDVKDK